MAKIPHAVASSKYSGIDQPHDITSIVLQETTKTKRLRTELVKIIEKCNVENLMIKMRDKDSF